MLFTDSEFDRVYKKIREELISEKSSEKGFISPVAAILGGQPGAGKSTLTKTILGNNENTVVIDGDSLRKYHPHLFEIQAEYKEDYPKVTQPFVSKMVETLLDDLSNDKYNLIIEGTLRDINVPLKTASLLSDKGYITELYIIATNKELSWASTILRGDAMKERGEIPRYVDRAHHDKVCDTLAENVCEIIDRGIFDNVVILDREQNVLYDMLETPEKDPKEILDLIMNEELEQTQIQSLDQMIEKAKEELHIKKDERHISHDDFEER